MGTGNIFDLNNARNCSPALFESVRVWEFNLGDVSDMWPVYQATAETICDDGGVGEPVDIANLKIYIRGSTRRQP